MKKVLPKHFPFCR